MFWRHITVREVNKYLSSVVDELTAKHGNVTSTEFEQELENKTGIKWKQVKNYRNHPTPGQVIRPNSKIKTFIYASRRRALIRRLRSRTTLVSALLVVTILAAAYHFGFRERQSVVPILTSAIIEKTEVAPLPVNAPYRPGLKFLVPDMGVTFRLGKITAEMKGVKWEDTVEKSGEFKKFTYRNTLGDPPTFLRIEIVTKGDDVTEVEVRGSRPGLVANLKAQIEEQTKSGFTQDKESGDWQNDSEMISTKVESNYGGLYGKNDTFVLAIISKFHQ